jgi:lipoprotein-releasing system permease protein
MLPFPLFLALKYLKPQRSFVSVVTLISVVGVMLGVAILVIVLSVMTGLMRTCPPSPAPRS